VNLEVEVLHWNGRVNLAQRLIVVS
jgi:hypothetical protein